MTTTEILSMTAVFLETAKHTNDLVDGTVRRFEALKKDRENLEIVQTRMLFNETMRNIELLNRVSLEPGNDIQVTDTDYLPVALQLSTQVHEGVLVYGDLHPEHRSLWQRMFGSKTVQLLDEEIESTPGIRAESLTVHQALLYTTNKMVALRNICHGDLAGSKVMRQVRYAVRLRNILLHEANIAETLYSSPAMDGLQHAALKHQIDRALQITG